MYSGTTLRKKSGRIIGAHQKIDRLAYRGLKTLPVRSTAFPRLHDILHFEGKNGPDGIKSKSPSQDEPWHYIDPENSDDRQLLQLVDDHRHNLIVALKAGDDSRAAFEAAWLAHSIVDGLTPAHHYPLADKIEELWGKPHDSRGSIKDKNIIKGTTRRDTLKKNWEYWGAKGVFTTHFMFEFGFASALAGARYDSLAPSVEQCASIESDGFMAYFERAIHEVYGFEMYESFYRHGWTRRLARQSKQQLAPLIVTTVALAWYDALRHVEDRL